MNYYAYIHSPAWRARADAAKRRAGYRCQVCNRPSSQVQLDAHHRTYERLGRELDSDITVLCRDCHELYESAKRLPSRALAPLPPSPPPPTVYLQNNADTPVLPTSTYASPSYHASTPSSVGPWIIGAIIIGTFWFALSLGTLQDRARESSAQVRVGAAIATPAATLASIVIPARAQPMGPIAATPTPRNSVTGVRPISQPTVTPRPSISHTAVVLKNANQRTGPSAAYPIVQTVRAGTQVKVIATNPARDWLLLDSGAWMAAFLVSPVTDLPVTDLSALPPTPLPAPVAASRSIPTATLRPLAGCAGGCATYPSHCAPPIKGNVSYNSGQRIYHVPGGEYYAATTINPTYGERWFCSEAEAQAAGWRRSSN
jgi:hypothetical protein